MTEVSDLKTIQERLRFFKARAERLKDERDQLRSDVAYQGSTILMLTNEKAALEKRIDELCQENERLRAANAAFTGRSIRAGDEMACLKAENAKLREERREYQATIDSLVDECTDHKAKNAKLRELVGGLEYCAGGFVCDCCPLHDPSGTNHRRCESLELELGIEVPA